MSGSGTTGMATAAAGVTITAQVHFGRAAKGAKRLREGAAPAPATPPAAGTVPRVARLVALALKLEGMVRRGEVRDYAELARVGRVTRARLSQLMNLTLLAPDIIDDLLHLPPTTKGRDPIAEHDLRAVAAEVDWGVQRRMWQKILEARRGRGPGNVGRSGALLRTPVRSYAEGRKAVGCAE